MSDLRQRGVQGGGNMQSASGVNTPVKDNITGDEHSETDFYSEWDPVAAAEGLQAVADKKKEKTLLPKKSRDEKYQQVTLEAQKPWAARSRNLKIRAASMVLMVTCFGAIIAAGHLYCALLVLILAMTIFHEIISLKRNVEKDKQLPLFFLLRWYIFFVTVLLGSRRFLADVYDDMAENFGPLAYNLMVRYNTFVTYILFVAGMLIFVLSLRKFTLRYQFHQMSWTIVVLLIVVVQACAMFANIYRGLIWFVMPQSLVIINDLMAYLAGFLFGRTPLIALSPKKTWEGFIGGSIFTMLWGVLTIWWLSRFSIFLCPQPSLLHKPFTYWDLECEVPTHFTEPSNYNIGGINIQFTDLQFHGLILALFASIIAPFGGFIASGFKRAFKIKDFGDSIPGHGGVTDRFDCHILMGMFTYVYLNSFVSITDPFEMLTHQVISLSLHEKQTLIQALQASMG